MIVDCKDCEALVDAVILATHKYDPEELDEAKLYSFLKCPRCNRPMLVTQNDAMEFDESRGTIWDDPYRLYPAPPQRVNPSLPAPVRTVYEEAVTSFRARAYTASVLMCRTTLQRICTSHGVLERNLADALRQLKEKGVIESRLYLWADALRITGNVAAHDSEATITREEASDVLDFTNALLEYVFTFQEKFEHFQQRRGNSASGGRTPGGECS